MAAAGQFVRERIPVHCSVPEAGRLVLELVGSSQDSQAETAGPMTFRVVRRYRPTWATLTGFLVAPLFVRRTEVCRVAVIEARTGAELLIEGDMDGDLHDALVHLGRVPEAARVATLGPRPVPQVLASQAGHPPPSPPQGGYSGFRPPEADQQGLYRPDAVQPRDAVESREAASPAARLAPPPNPFAPPPQLPAVPPVAPAPVPVAKPEAAPVDASALRGASIFQPPALPGSGLGSAGTSNGTSNGASSNGAPASWAAPAQRDPATPDPVGSPPPATTAMAGKPRQIQVSVDTGEQSMIAGLVLAGRAPSRGEDESHAVLLTIDDPSLSVSKTHLAIGVDAVGLWVIDRHSTNGTWIDEGRGELQGVEPGKRTAVPVGARVLIGERVLTFTRQGG